MARGRFLGPVSGLCQAFARVVGNLPIKKSLTSHWQDSFTRTLYENEKN